MTKSSTSTLQNSSKELLQVMERLFHGQTNIALRDIVKIATTYTPLDLAYAAGYVPVDAKKSLYDNLPNREGKIQFILNTDSETREVLFERMGDIELGKLFEKMSPDSALWLMDGMSSKKCKQIIPLLSAKKVRSIWDLKRHAKNSAARLMTSEFFSFSIDDTVQDVTHAIRENPHIDFSRGIFIINEQGKLQGSVPPRNMIISADETSLRRIVHPILHKVTSDTTREEIIEIVERYKVVSLPVVDDDNRVVGVITYEDVLEAMEDSTDEMFAHIAGTKESGDYHGNFFKPFIARAPWLIVTLIAGLVNVGFMSFFQKYEHGLLTFALFFVPLITGMSGNIGIQSSTILVRNLALGSFSLDVKKEIVYKEICNGMFTGLVFGIGCALATFVGNIIFRDVLEVSPFIVSSIVGIGLIGACLAGTFLGVFSPLFFSKIGIDPAVSSGPIVTAFNDCFSMVIYFLIAWGISTVFF